jgi:predicted peptidase
MKQKLIGLLLIALMIVYGCSSELVIKDGGTKRQVGKKMTTNFEQEVSLNYLLALPKDYEQKEKWPLLMFLHGSGERGNDLELLKKHGPPRLIEEGKEFPFIVVSPQCPSGIRWKTNALAALIDEMIKNYNVDENRIYVTGLSMGGYGTWKLANEISEKLAAVVPICGWGDSWTICEIGDLPVWAFHGGKDNVVVPQKSQELVDALKRCNGNVKFTLYPEANHDSWTETYNNPEVYKWLLEQSLDKRKKLKSNWF